LTNRNSIIFIYKGTVIHVLYDNNPEEEVYHAMFMKSRMEEAGLKCKAYLGIKDFAFDNNGNVIDSDGVQVKLIWKC